MIQADLSHLGRRAETSTCATLNIAADIEIHLRDYFPATVGATSV
jgi:hypothetical protein